MTRHPIQIRPRACAALLVLAVGLVLLAACSSDPERKPLDFSALRRPEPLKPQDDPRVQAYVPQMQRAEALVTRWDALRADGRVTEAAALEPQIRQEVDGDFGTFERASTGAMGPQAQYLAVSVLGFSASPQATRVLVNRLGDRDAQLVGNALIALGVRADPATPQDVIVARVAPTMPLVVKRYAPLALANVMQARMRAGLPVQPTQERVLLARLGTIVTDHDPITRLHTVKALSAMRIPGTFEYLSILARDPTMRVRWAAAAALAEEGDPRGFPDVVRLLGDAAHDSKPVIRDILIAYADKLLGRPLTASEIASLGTGPRAWGQWYNEVVKPRLAAQPTPRGNPAR